MIPTNQNAALLEEMYRRGQPPEKKLTLDWRKVHLSDLGTKWLGGTCY